MTKAEMVDAYETGTGITIKEYVTKILGYKCCESWSKEELIDEFGYGYLKYVDECMSRR